MKYLEETLQGECAWPGRDELQRRLMTSRPVEETLGFLRFMAIFYNNFTTLLRDLYDSM
jgi:hypothetical protein